jgi:pseudouridine synthase
VGRLDFNSDGLLLLTNDGELSEKIQKSDAFPRIYIVKIKGEITDEYLARLKHPLKVDHRFIKADRVRIKQELNKKTQVEIVFTHGAGIDVKAFFELKGFLVEKITRTTYGNLTLGDLKPGHYRQLNKSQLEALINQPELGLTRMDQESEKEDKKLFRAKKLAQKREAYSTTKTVLKPLEGKPSFKSKFSKNKLGFSNDKPARAGKSTLTAKSAFGKSPSRTPRSDDRPSFGASRPSRATGAKFKLTVRKKPSSRF